MINHIFQFRFSRFPGLGFFRDSRPKFKFNYLLLNLNNFSKPQCLKNIKNPPSYRSLILVSSLKKSRDRESIIWTEKNRHGDIKININYLRYLAKKFIFISVHRRKMIKISDDSLQEIRNALKSNSQFHQTIFHSSIQNERKKRFQKELMS